MSRSSAPTPAAGAATQLEHLRLLLRASEALGGGEAVLLQLCLLAGLHPGEAMRCRLEDVGWRMGVLLTNGGRRPRLVALSYAAQATILQRAGGVGGSGPIVVVGDGRGARRGLPSSTALRIALADASPDTADVAWTWRSVRRGIQRELVGDGVDLGAADLFLGRRPRGGDPMDRFDPWGGHDMVAVANRWARLLLPPSADWT